MAANHLLAYTMSVVRWLCHLQWCSLLLCVLWYIYTYNHIVSKAAYDVNIQKISIFTITCNFFTSAWCMVWQFNSHSCI